jgi:hypothetical protein
MRVGSDFTVLRNDFATGTASCNAGERATGGGVYPKSNVYFPRVGASFPTPNPASFTTPNNAVTPTGWRVWVSMDDTAGFTAPASVTETPYVICAAP